MASTSTYSQPMASMMPTSAPPMSLVSRPYTGEPIAMENFQSAAGFVPQTAFTSLAAGGAPIAYEAQPPYQGYQPMSHYHDHQAEANARAEWERQMREEEEMQRQMEEEEYEEVPPEPVEDSRRGGVSEVSKDQGYSMLNHPDYIGSVSLMLCGLCIPPLFLYNLLYCNSENTIARIIARFSQMLFVVYVMIFLIVIITVSLTDGW
mmetsp:Transcript_57168/g.102163  ORF Transcript_57168/g.102163 Transcript_57168/m.102163 type:complete len:206 (-) Transcript_57168:1074-1691(-)